MYGVNVLYYGNVMYGVNELTEFAGEASDGSSGFW